MAVGRLRALFSWILALDGSIGWITATAVSCVAVQLATTARIRAVNIAVRVVLGLLLLGSVADRFGFLGPVWYWTVARPDINSLCDARDLEGVTRRINGGLNGIEDRRQRWERCLAMGERLLPNLGEVIMSLADEELGKKFPSRSIYRHTDGPIDTVAGFISNMDARIHEESVERAALAGDPNAIELVKRVAENGIVGKTDGFDGGNHDDLVARSAEPLDER